MENGKQLYLVRKGDFCFRFVSDRDYDDSIADAKRREIENHAREFGSKGGRTNTDYWMFIVNIPESLTNKGRDHGYTIVDDYIVAV